MVGELLMGYCQGSAFPVKTVERAGDRSGGRGKGEAAGFIGILYKREDSYQVRLAKDSLGKSTGSGSMPGLHRGQVYSRTRMRPSSSGTAGAFHVEV